MAISHKELREAAPQYRESVMKSQGDAARVGRRSAFLCHSHLDVELVKGLVTLMEKAGWNVYVDWADTSMPATPNRETARKIKDRIKSANFFLFLATKNSMVSRWCPWEIGYADGVKNIDNILIVPTSDDGGTHHGNEYLQLYRRVERTSFNVLGVFSPDSSSLEYLKDL